MATQHSNLLSILLFVATFFYIHPPTAAVRDFITTTAPAPGPIATPNSSDTSAVAFIRSICGGTNFPDACFSSLSRYADAIKGDPAELTRIALSLSLTKARGLASHMSNVTAGGADPSGASDHHDCSSILGEVIDNTQISVKVIRRVNSGGNAAGSFRMQISNAQTLMRAALANVDSCATELEGTEDGAMKANTENQVTELKKLVSNALDIVNIYAQKIS